MPSERSNVGMLTLRESMPPLNSIVIDHQKRHRMMQVLAGPGGRSGDID
jgi:hypothetical protein